jgi:hypothetical protein
MLVRVSVSDVDEDGAHYVNKGIANVLLLLCVTLLLFTHSVTCSPSLTSRSTGCSLWRTPVTIVMRTCTSSDSPGLHHFVDYLPYIYVNPFGSFSSHHCFCFVCVYCSRFLFCIMFCFILFTLTPWTCFSTLSARRYSLSHTQYRLFCIWVYEMTPMHNWHTYKCVLRRQW